MGLEEKYIQSMDEATIDYLKRNQLRFETQKIDGLRFKVSKSKAQVVISNIGAHSKLA